MILNDEIKLDHNPLIQSETNETLTNVAEALSFIQCGTFGTTSEKNELPPSAISGFYYLMDCVKWALMFEAKRAENGQ